MLRRLSKRLVKERNREVTLVLMEEDQEKKVRAAIEKAINKDKINIVSPKPPHKNYIIKSNNAITLMVSVNNYILKWEIPRKDIGSLDIYARIIQIDTGLKKL